MNLEHVIEIPILLDGLYKIGVEMEGGCAGLRQSTIGEGERSRG